MSELEAINGYLPKAFGNFTRTEDGRFLLTPEQSKYMEARNALMESAKEVRQTADVMKQWDNPCVREAYLKTRQLEAYRELVKLSRELGLYE